MKDEKKGSSSYAEVYHQDLWGTRDYKYKLLINSSIQDMEYKRIDVVGPEYNFTPTNIDAKEKYNKGFSLESLFNKFSVGVVTAKDKVLIGSSFDDLYRKVKNFYGIEPENEKIHPIYYRPLDKRYIYYDPKLLERSREGIMTSFFKNNIGLITARSNKGDDCTQFLITDVMSEAKCGERTTQSSVFPLYLYSYSFGKYSKQLNLNMEIVTEISNRIRAPFIDEINRSKESFSGKDLLAYIYAILYLKGYREKYKQFINADFPRIPYPKDKEIFDHLCTYGYELIETHLMNENVQSNIPVMSLVGKEIEKVGFKNGKVFISKNDYFENVDEEVWKFTMCGYQPLQKWMKDKKGTMLQESDVHRFYDMEQAIRRTIIIMNQMDADDFARSIIP